MLSCIGGSVVQRLEESTRDLACCSDGFKSRIGRFPEHSEHADVGTKTWIATEKDAHRRKSTGNSPGGIRWLEATMT